MNLSGEEFLSRAVARSPDIIIFEPNSAEINDVLHIAKTLKEQTGALIVLVGTHVTAEYRDIIDPWWLVRQVRYLGRLGSGAGMKGLYRRAIRYYRIVKGDSTAVIHVENQVLAQSASNEHTPTIRW